MENAAHALRMAGGLLISVVIISMLMLMWNSLTSYKETNIISTRTDKILEFNAQFEGYNRKGVRGNDLFSLISRVTDYNFRESTLNPDTNQYEPMKVNLRGSYWNFSMDNTSRVFYDSEYTFSSDEYGNTLRDNTFGKITRITTTNIMPYAANTSGSGRISGVNKNFTYYYLSEAQLDRLVTAYDSIFVSDTEFKKKTQEEKLEIFWNFNKAIGDDFFVMDYDDKKEKITTNLDDLWDKMLGDGWYASSSWRTDKSFLRYATKAYYEYRQFKRAIFDIVDGSVTYSNTGRILTMTFRFTGKFY